MGTVPKPKRTVTIQMGPHIAVVDSFGNKEPSANWEKEPNPKPNSTSTPPKEQRQENVCVNVSVTHRIHHSRQPSRADVSASASAGHGGNKDSEGPIGRGLLQTGALIGQGAGDTAALIGQGAGDSAALIGQGAGDSRALIGQDEGDSRALIGQGEGDSAALIGQGVGDLAALIDQGGGELRESSRKGCQASAVEEPPIPPKDDLQACDGSSTAQGFDERPVDRTAGRLRTHTSEGFQKCKVTSVLGQASRETSGPERAASEAQAPKRDRAAIPADEDVPLKSDGSVRTSHLAQTAKPEVCQESSEQQGREREETSLLGPSEALSGGRVTSAALLDTEPADARGMLSLDGPAREGPGAQKDSDGSSCPSSSSRPRSSAPLLRDSAGGQSGPDCAARATEGGGPQSAGAEKQEAQPIQRGLCQRFQDAATMTVSPERGSGCSGATWRDAEVQAVPEVCSRSAGPSPCRSPPLATAPPQICSAAVAGGGDDPPAGAGPEHAGSQPAAHPTPRDDAQPEEGGDFSDACVQTAVSVAVSARTRADPSPPAASSQGRGGSGGSPGKSTRASPHSGSAGHHDMELGARPKEPGLHLGHGHIRPAQLVHQINMEASSHPSGSNEPSIADLQCLTQSESFDGDRTECLQDKPTASDHACHAVVDVISLPDQSASSPTAPACSPPLDSGLQVKTPGVRSHQVEPLVVEPCAERKDDPCEVKSGPESEQSGSKAGPGQRDADVPPRPDQGGGSADEDKPGAAAQAAAAVMWDEQGMTWEVYGAAVTTESLGFAIQSHLMCKIKEHEKQIQRQTTCMRKPPLSSSGGSPRKRPPRSAFRSLLQNVRRPKCCLRAPPSVLE